MHEPDPLASLRSNPALLRRAAFAHFDFDIVSSEQRYPIGVRPDRIDLRSGDGQPDFTVRADSAAWAEFAKIAPRPGYNDVVAMIEAGHAQFEGEALAFFRHLFLVKEIVAAIFKGDPRL